MIIVFAGFLIGLLIIGLIVTLKAMFFNKRYTKRRR